MFVCVCEFEVWLSSLSEGEVVCEPPNNKLDRFCGTLYWREKKYTLTNQSMLLRGCVLRNTEACYGLVIFAGVCGFVYTVSVCKSVCVWCDESILFCFCAKAQTQN